MNKDFIDSINSAENSNEEFFDINFGPKKIKILGGYLANNIN